MMVYQAMTLVYYLEKHMVDGSSVVHAQAVTQRVFYCFEIEHVKDSKANKSS